jgi:hypothetical protein
MSGGVEEWTNILSTQLSRVEPIEFLNEKTNLKQI